MLEPLNGISPQPLMSKCPLSAGGAAEGAAEGVEGFNGGPQLIVWGGLEGVQDALTCWMFESTCHLLQCKDESSWRFLTRPRLAVINN